MACPFTLAVPIVALNLWALILASADWVSIPFGKKISLPNLDRESRKL